jgi:hypothetical protein
MFDQDLNIIIKQDVTLTSDQWDTLQKLAQAAQLPSIPKLMAAIANNPPLIEKMAANLMAKSIDYGDIFNTPVVRPMKPVSETLSFIETRGDTIAVRHGEKDETWLNVVKPLGYHWDRPFWTRTIKVINGNVIDRAAELGHKLLVAGFCVVFPNPTIRDKAIAGDYLPEQRRWIMARTGGDYKNHFYIHWERGEDCYDLANQITGAMYSKPGILVSPEYFDEVLDFANVHEFSLTEAAQELVKQCKAWRESAMVVDLSEIGNQIDSEPNIDLSAFDEVEIPDELIDDPL